MKVFICRTSSYEESTMEVDTLDDCINKLILLTGEKKYVVSKAKDHPGLVYQSVGCEWYVEIYDTYRE